MFQILELFVALLVITAFVVLAYLMRSTDMLSQMTPGRWFGVVIGLGGVMVLGVTGGLWWIYRHRKHKPIRVGELIFCTKCGEVTRLPVNDKSKRKGLRLCKECFEEVNRVDA